MSLNLTQTEFTRVGQPPAASPRPLALYVHHHGSGHATRCKQIAAHWPTSAAIHVFTSAPQYFAGWTGGTLHTLPPDTAPGRDPAADTLQNKIIHYAPTGLPGVSRRMAYLANWIAQHRPALFIVDLSVEIALFAKLCGVRTALVRLHGRRTDPAHRAAFQLADEIICPFPACLEDEHTKRYLREKSTYLGVFSRYDGRRIAQAEARRRIGYTADKPLILVVNGGGGATRSLSYWESVATANPDQHWWLLGHVSGTHSDLENLHVAGFREDTFPYLRAADIVVGSGGTNTMSEICAAGARYLSLPEARPYSEQWYKMTALQRYGLTRILKELPAPGAWQKWIRRAGDLRPDRWRKLRRTNKLTEAVAGLAARARVSV